MDAGALGRYLRNTREARQLTLQDAVQQLKIRRYILESFEMGDFALSHLSNIQIKGFIRNYARYLGLDETRVIGIYELSQNQMPSTTQLSVDPSGMPYELPNAATSITDTQPTLPSVLRPVSLQEMAERRYQRYNLLNRVVMFLVAAAALSVILWVSYELIRDPASGIVVDQTPHLLLSRQSQPRLSPPIPSTTATPDLAVPTSPLYRQHKFFLDVV